MDDLPTEYDAIVVGTGMIESIVAAALSRVGKSVLHLDANEYYGDDWASFNLEGFENWISSCNENKTSGSSKESFDHLISENEKIVEIKPKSWMQNGSLNHFVIGRKVSDCDTPKDKANEEGEEAVDAVIENKNSEEPQDLHKLSRRFNLDLFPKLLFSKGLLVDLLITSNIARYAEFKSVSRVLTWRDGRLEPVPCSRADVFATKNVTVVHKRLLVKILAIFADYIHNLEEFRGFESKTFLEYLKHKKLPENLIHYILYAIAMGDNTTGCLDGVKNCKRFLESLGRYGNTPFIFPMYGAGELPQCFCRLCAVFGGVYCLQRGIEGIIVKDDECVGVISNKKRLNAKNVILSSRYTPKGFTSNEHSESLSRAVFITDSSILKGDKETLTLLQFPPVAEVSDKSVRVIELGSGTCTCPDNYFVVHMTAKMTKDASSDFAHVVESLFGTENQNNGRPRVLWSAAWNVVKESPKTDVSLMKNLKICCSVDYDLDYTSCVNEARTIFKELCPEEEFLPRAPDPDEIVLDAEESPSDADIAKAKSSEGRESAEGTTHPPEGRPDGESELKDTTEKDVAPDS